MDPKSWIRRQAMLLAAAYRSKDGFRPLLVKFVGGSLCAGSFLFATNTVVLGWNKASLQLIRDNAFIEPAPKLKTLLDKVATDLKLSDSARKSVKLFTSNSDIGDAFGTVAFRHGVLLGVPATANAESVADVPLEIKLGNKTKSQEIINKIEELREVSVLSDAAKLFVIAEGLVLARDPNYFIFPALSASLCVMASFLQGSLLSLRVNFKVYSLQNPLYTLSLVMWGFVFIFGIIQLRELLLRQEMGHLSKEYVDGGVEFYSKLQQQRQLKKELCGHWILDIGGQYIDEIVPKRLSTLIELQSKFTCDS